MNNARTIFWLFVLTLAAVAANVFLAWRVPAVRALPRRTLLDPSFAPTSLIVARAGAPETVLRKDERWTLVRPYSGAVDAQVVLRLLDVLAATPVGDSMTDAELLKLGRTRKDLGLDEPKLTLTVSDGAGTSVFSFGDFTPTSNGVYTAVGGSGSVSIVPEAVRAAADLGADAFRARGVFPHDPEFVQGFDLRKADETPLAFVRSGDGWKVGDAVASSAQIRDFLALLAGANAADFFWPLGATNEETTVSEARLVGYGLDAGAAVSVTLHCRDGVDRRVLFGDDVGDGKVYALVHNGGAIVSVGSRLKAAAIAGMRTFVDARLFPLEEASVASFTLTDGATSYVVARGEAGAWRLDAPVVAPADPQFASELLGRLLAMTPSDLAENGIRASVSTNLEPCVVSAQALLGKARLEDLRLREILRVDATLVKRLVSAPGGRKAGPTVSVVYSRERKAWSEESEEERDRTVDGDAVERLLGALAPLEAARIVTLTAAPSDLARYGLDQPFHTVSVDQEKDGAVRRNIFIGAETKDGRYATVGSAEAIFILPKKTVQALVAPLVER